MTNIFIIPKGRTGGTLFCTLLDAHPDLKMGYEIYPDRLCHDDGTGLNVDTQIRLLKKTKHRDPVKWINALPRNNFRVFCARARRSGIEPARLLEELKLFNRTHNNIESIDDRLDFIDRLLNRQRIDSNCTYSGSKMLADPYLLHRRHPAATFYMMVRDGRDVLDSRLKVGNFKTNAKACALDWVESIENFKQFLKKTDAKGCFVPYEELVYKPQETLETILAASPINFHADMIDYLKKNPALLNAPQGHLSAKQIAKGINDQSINRWQQGLTQNDLMTFTEIAENTLKEFGYEV